MPRPRVLLADDHQILLDAFETLLTPRYEVVGRCTNGRDLLDVAVESTPDVIVLDISMPGLNGLDAAWHLRELVPQSKLIFLTVNDDPEIAAEALAGGAAAYLLKGSAASELFRAIDGALVGDTYVTPSLRAQLDVVERHPDRMLLTRRQREVLQLLAEGQSMKQAAAALGISTRTVAFHKYGIMKAVGVKSSAELVQLAIKQGLVESS